MSRAMNRFVVVAPGRLCRWRRLPPRAFAIPSSPQGAAAKSLEQSADLNLQRALDLLGAGRYLSAGGQGQGPMPVLSRLLLRGGGDHTAPPAVLNLYCGVRLQ